MWHWLPTEDRAVWSSQLRAMAGVPDAGPPPTIDEFIAKVHPDDRARLEEWRRDPFAEPEAAARIRLRRGSGWAVLDAQVMTMRGDDGGPGVVFGTFQDVTDRLRAASELELTARLLDQVDAAVIGLSPERVITHWNRGAEELYGWRRDEAVGRTAADLDLVPDVLEERRSAAWKAMQERGRWQGHFDIRTKAGDLVPVYSTTTLVRDGAGEVVGSIGVSVDDREHRRAIEEVQESRKLLRALVDGAPMPVFIKDTEQRYVLANHHLEEAYGAPPDGVVGRTDAELIGRDAAHVLERNDREALSSGNPVAAEETLELPSGERIYLSHRFPLRDSDGEIWAVCGIATEITARRHVERELGRRLSEQSSLTRFGRRAIAGGDVSALLEEAAVLAADTLDADAAKILELDPGGKRLLVRAAVGFSEVPGDVDQVATDASHAGFTLASHGPTVSADYDREERFRVSDMTNANDLRSGVQVPIEARAGAFGVLGVHSRSARDYTEREVAFLEGLATVLAAVIARDREESMEAELRRAQRLESVGKLAGGIAHDFNNILSVILNYSKFLAEDLEGTQREEALEIRHSAERAAQLTSQLLQFGRSEPFGEGSADGAHVLEEMRSLLQRALGEDIRLVVDVAPGLAPVKLERSELEQIVMNLVVNARDAMPDGGELSIRLGPSAPARDAGRPDDLEITIADTGTGMTQEVMQQIFDPFFTTKGPGEGTGLGMATVYGIASRVGGDVAVDSAPGDGTTVTVRLPAGTEVGDREVGEDDGPPPQGAGETILLVEDDDRVRRMAARILLEAGYRVIQAGDGAEAIRAFEDADGVSLLVTDLVMPGMSGRELASLLGAEAPELPVLFVSGYSTERVNPSDHGAESRVLRKPFTEGTLLLAVRQGLEDAALEGVVT